MTDFAVRDLASRMDNLERQNRRLKRTVSALFLIAVTVLTVGAAAPGSTKDREDVLFGTLRARKVVISDNTGRERLVLGLDSNEPTLKMFNHKGQRQVFLGIDELWDDTAYLSVSSRLDGGDVDKQAVLAVTPGQSELSGSSQLVLFDAKPPQKNAALSHLVRLSSGQAAQNPYLEIHGSSSKETRHVNLDLLRAKPDSNGQRVLLDTNPEPAALRGVKVAPMK